MSRVNVYLSDELADAARRAGLNISGLTQEAIRAALAGQRTTEWLDAVIAEPPLAVDRNTVRAAIEGAKDELERGRG